MNQSLILEYLSDKQVGEPWRGFLAAMSHTLLARYSVADLRTLMHDVGEQFANSHPLPACKSLDDLELAIGAVWVDRHWGWAMLEEIEDSLRIRHYAAPLAVAMGDPEMHWSGAFLEGCYQVWLSQLGAAPGLKVRQVGVAEQCLCLELELRR
jgi:hypothetical protein